jgi:hypothetical protein
MLVKTMDSSLRFGMTTLKKTYISSNDIGMSAAER